MTKPNKNNGLSPLQRLERSFVWLMASPDFIALSGVAMVGKTSIVSDDKWKAGPMKSAYTDGYNVVMHEDFVSGLTDQELRFALIHENMHKCFRHMTTWQNLFRENAMLANISCDLRINADLLAHNNLGISMPGGGLFDKKYEDSMKWDSYHIFQDLKKNGLPQSMECNGNCKQGDGSGEQGGQCTCQGFDEHGWDEADSMSDAEKREAEQAIDSAIRQGAILAGKMAGTLDRSIEELLAIKTDWREILREFMTANVRGSDESTWRRPNRRHIAQDVYMPSQISDSMGEVVISIDVSGSISGPELTLFLSHVMRVLQTVKPENCRVLFWDTQVAGDQLFTPDQYDRLPQLVKIVGGGGTSPAAITRHMAKNKITPQVCIVLTDGYIDSAPTDWPCPVLWAVSHGNESFTVPSGQIVVHLPENL